MLNPKVITIGKLKQAYELSGHDVDDLMAELLPDNIFPLAVWEVAYNEHWLRSLKSNSMRYDIDIPKLPDTSPLPEKYFMTSLHSNLIKEFFGELIRATDIDALGRGIDYIIECAYGKGGFPFEEAKKILFTSLHEEERVIENRQRESDPLVINFMESTNYEFVSDLFFDSIAVDKALSIKFFSSSGYNLLHEVKGVTHSLVESITNSPAESTLASHVSATP